MGKITDAIMSLFNSDKVIITDSGQKVVGLEPILEEVKGLDIIEVDTGDGGVDTVADDVSRETDTTELSQYADYNNFVALQAVVDTLEKRLATLEAAIEITDNLTGEKSGGIEEW